MRMRGKACLLLVATMILPSILLALSVVPVKPEPGPDTLYFHREAAPPGALYGTYNKTMNASSPTYSSGDPATVTLTVTGGAQESLVWYGPAYVNETVFLSGAWEVRFWYTASAPVNAGLLVAWFNETWGGPQTPTIVGWTGDNKISLGASLTPTEAVFSQSIASYTVPAGGRLGAIIRNPNATLTVYYDCAGRESRIETPGVAVAGAVARPRFPWMTLSIVLVASIAAIALVVSIARRKKRVHGTLSPPSDSAGSI